MIGQPQTGETSSIPKFVTLLGADSGGTVYKKMGNGHIVPTFWATSVTISGTTATVASGISYHGQALADSAYCVATPRTTVAQPFWIERNTSTNELTLTAAGTVDTVFDVLILL